MTTVNFCKPFHNRYLSTFHVGDVSLVVEPVAPTSSPDFVSRMRSTETPSVFFSRSLSPNGPYMIYKLVRMRFPKNIEFHSCSGASGTASGKDSATLHLISLLTSSAREQVATIFTESPTSIAPTSLRQTLLKFGANLISSLPTVGWTAMCMPDGAQTER